MEALVKTLRYGGSGFVFIAVAMLIAFLNWSMNMHWLLYLASMATAAFGAILALSLIDIQREPVELVEFKDGDKWAAICPKCGDKINSDWHSYGCHMKHPGICLKGCKQFS